MLLTFRLFFIAAGLAIVAVAITTRGLVPEPEARTRIGEIPGVGRSLVLQAMMPLTEIERISVAAANSRDYMAERSRDLTLSAPPAPAAPDEAIPAPAPAADSRATSSDPIAELIRRMEAEAIAAAPRVVPEDATIPARSPAEPSVRGAASEIASQGPVTPVDGKTEGQAPAPGAPPALAFGAEREAAPKPHAPAGERTAATPPKPAAAEVETPKGVAANVSTEPAKPKATPKAGSRIRSGTVKRHRVVKRRATIRPSAASLRSKARARTTPPVQQRVVQPAPAADQQTVPTDEQATPQTNQNHNGAPTATTKVQ